MSREYIAIAHALREKESRDNRALLNAAACAIEALIKDLGAAQSANSLLTERSHAIYRLGAKTAAFRFADLLLTLYEEQESDDEITVGELRQHIEQITKDLTGV